MILDHLSRLEAIAQLGGAFADAAAFLARPDLAALPDGPLEVGRRGAVATVSRQRARHAGEGRLEAHRLHADIQVLLGGRESIGWLPLTDVARPATAYDPGADIQFFEGQPQVWVHLRPGQFALFLPADAHLPLVGEDLIHKLVVKVPVAGGWPVALPGAPAAPGPAPSR